MKQLKQWQIIIIVFATMAFIVIFNQWFSCSCLRMIGVEEVDRTDYALVGDHFIRKNGFIGNKLGKVVSIPMSVRAAAAGVPRSMFSAFGAPKKRASVKSLS